MLAICEHSQASCPRSSANGVVKEVCDHFKHVLDPDAYDEEPVLKSTNALGDAAKVGDKLAKKMGLPRLKKLAAKARAHVQQRGIDECLEKELVHISSTLKKLKDLTGDMVTDDALVAVRFNSKELSKLRLRFNGVLSKTSDRLKERKKGLLEECVRTLLLAQRLWTAFYMEGFGKRSCQPWTSSRRRPKARGRCRRASMQRHCKPCRVR